MEMKDLLSIVLILVYVGAIYRYSVIFLPGAGHLVYNIPEFSRLGILGFGAVLYVAATFNEVLFESRLLVVLVIGFGLFYFL